MAVAGVMPNVPSAPISARRKVRLAYILAASHSGSTLLAMVLGSHPEVATAGELKLTAMGNVTRYRCSCREEFRKCRFWAEIGKEMAGRGFAFEPGNAGTDFQSIGSAYARFLLRPLHRARPLEALRDVGLLLSPAWRRDYGRVQAANAALVACIMERSGKKVVVDSSKVGIRLKYLLRNRAIDVRVVRLVRDGRAVALTYMDSARFADASDERFRGGGMGIVADYPRLRMAEAAREWRRSNEEAENLLDGLDPSRSTTVRYERFCRDPQGEASRIFDFLGVAPDDAVARFRSAVHHVVGNGMRLDDSREVRLDERWRDVLSAAELRVFEAVAGAMNKRLGYDG